MTDSILLIHDDSTLLRSIGARFEQAGCEVLRELTGEAGVATLERSRPDVVCLAMHLAEASPALVGRLAGYEAPVIGFGEKLSAEATAHTRIAGASRVADLSVDPDLLFNLAQLAGAEGRRRRAAEAVIRAGSPRFGADSLGGSAPMRHLSNQLGLLAQSERTTVLLTGETGVGKAWAARVIHDLGVRAGRPFMEVRVGGQNPSYLESLIFGHERGAFVEASARRRGYLELADGGTLLLREVADLPAELQPKVLRVLETRTFRRIGGTHDITVDTRLVVTTRRDLAAEVEAERFRQDLFYRLNVMTLAMPPLRDRSQDDRAGLIAGIHGELKGLYTDSPQIITPTRRAGFSSTPGRATSARCSRSSSARCSWRADRSRLASSIFRVNSGPAPAWAIGVTPP